MDDFVKFKILKDKQVITLDWEIGLYCNFNCEYCMSSSHNSSLRHKYDFPTEYDSFFKFTDKLQSKYKKPLYLYLLGGEPVLWKLIKPFLKECKQRNISVSIISNGSKSINFWKTILPYLDRILLSYHNNFTKPKHLIELIKLALKNDVYAQVKYLVNPETFKDDIKLANEIADKGDCLVTLGIIRRSEGDFFNYSKKQLDFLVNKRSIIHNTDNLFDKTYYIILYKANGSFIRIKNLNEVLVGNYNHWKNWYCWAGITNFYVSETQQIYGCHKKLECIGNLKDKDIILPTKPIKCTAEICSCFQDIECCKKQKEV